MENSTTNGETMENSTTNGRPACWVDPVDRGTVDFATMNAIDNAAGRGDLDRLKRLMDAAGTPATIHSTSYAAASGHYDVVDFLLSRGGGVHGQGMQSLLDRGDFAMIRHLVSKDGLIMGARATLGDALESARISGAETPTV